MALQLRASNLRLDVLLRRMRTGRNAQSKLEKPAVQGGEWRSSTVQCAPRVTSPVVPATTTRTTSDPEHATVGPGSWITSFARISTRVPVAAGPRARGQRDSA